MKLGTVLTIMAVIASAMAVMFVLHAEADDSSAELIETGSCGPESYYCIYSDGTLKICGSGEMYDYEYVRAPWYEYRDDITSIMIDGILTKLGAWAFVGLKHVTELTMPITLDSVVSDLYPAFAGCYNIEKITFTYGTNGCGYNYSAYSGFDSWYQNTPWYQSRDVLKEIKFTYGVEYIGSDSFRELNITSVVLPDTVCSLGNHCFYNCTKLTHLTLPVSLNSYGNETYPAFGGCTEIGNITITRGNGVPFDYTDWCDTQGRTDLAPWNMNLSIAKSITVADDVTSLGKYMFVGCNIYALTLPVNLEWYGDNHAFCGIYRSLEKLTLTQGTTGRGPDTNCELAEFYPWYEAPNLKTLVVEDGVTYLGDYMFYECSIITVVLPDSLTSFGESPFYFCKMTNLTIPISLNAVWLDRYYAFFHISGLQRITFTPGSGYGMDYAAYSGSNCWYQNTPWYQCRSTLIEITLEDGIRHIGSDAFRELNLTYIFIPDSVESLGCHTFYNCSKLQSLTIPISLDAVCSATYPAFDGCLGIKVLRFTAGTDGVGVDYTDCVPVWCTTLHRATQIYYDSGIDYIGTNTFEGYIFLGPDGNYVPPTAANLSGHKYSGYDGVMKLDDPMSGCQEIPVCSDYAGVCSAVKLELTEIRC